MSPKDALKLSIGMSDFIINAYIKDLSDADLFIRPVPGMNHIAWQLGHLISAEHRFVEMVKPELMPGVTGRFRRGPHQGKDHARRSDEVLPAFEVPRALAGTAGGNSVCARQCSRVRPGQDRPREVPRVGSDRGRATGDDRYSRADALRPVCRRPASVRQAGDDLNANDRTRCGAAWQWPCRAVVFRVPSPSAHRFPGPRPPATVPAVPGSRRLGTVPCR